MNFKHIDMTSALRRLAERRIDQAMEEGKFNNLKGSGQPLDLEPLPADENARLMWWALRIMKQNDYTPDEVRWRKSIELMKAELEQSRDASRVRMLVGQINLMVTKLNTLGTNAMTAASAVSGVSVDVELEKLAERLQK